MRSTALDLARSATTSAEFATAIDALKAEHAAVEASRPDADRALQDAIFAGKDEAKARSAIQEVDARLLTLKAAIDGATRRMAVAEAKEATDHKQSCAKEMHNAAYVLEAAAKKRAEAISFLRAANAEMFAANDALTRKTHAAGIAGVAERDRPNPLTIVTKATGDVPHYGGNTVFEIRADRTLYEFATGNPFQRMRERSLADGRDGETRQARGMAYAAIKNQGG